MRSVLETEDIQAIVQAVIEAIQPLLNGNGKDEDEDKLMTVKKLSEYTGLSRQWIYNNKAKLEPVYLNGKPLFWKSKIKAMLKTERHKNTKSNIPLRGFKQQNSRGR